MRTKHSFFGPYKTLNVLLLLVLLFSIHGANNLPVAYAQGDRREKLWVKAQEELELKTPSLETTILKYQTVILAVSKPLEESIKRAVEKHRLDPTHDYYYKIIDIVEYGEWGLAKVEQLLKETDEIILGDNSLILCHKDIKGNWVVTLPDDVKRYLGFLNLFPESQLNNATKAQIRSFYNISTQSLFSNHYLPWTKGTTATVIRNYSEHGEGKLDLGFVGNIRTTKAGTLEFAYDAHTWSNCTGQSSCNNYQYAKYYNNAVVLKHADGEYSAYLHMQTNSIPENIIKNCNNGSGGPCNSLSIPVGTIIGSVGSIGQSTSPHLHYETGSLPYKKCNYPDVYDEDGDGNVEELTVCSGGVVYTQLVATSFHEIPYTAPNCGTVAGQDPKLCILHYPNSPGLTSQNPSSGSLGFNSQFTSNASGWTPLNGDWSVSTTNGYYHTLGISDLFVSTMHSYNYSKLTYAVKIKRSGCANCGVYIYFRGNPNPITSAGTWNNGYVFEYTNTGYYIIGKQEGGLWTSFMSDWAYSPAITNNWNTLKVTANGSFIQFFINNTRVLYGNFSNFSTGKVGIGFWRDTIAGNHLYVDWATLSTTAPSLIVSGEGILFNELGERVNPDAMPDPRMSP